MRGRLVARERELASIDAFLEPQAKHQRMLLIEGEPGIGKSALWEAAVDMAGARGFGVLSSRPAESEQRLQNVVLTDLLEPRAAQVLPDLPPARRRALESALLLDDAGAVAGDLRALPAALVTVLTMLAEERTLVLAIDDDQWIDTSSASVLAFALRRLAQVPILLVLARRAGAHVGHGLDSAVQPSRVEHLEIGPMSMDAIQLMLDQQLDRSLPKPVLRRVHEAAGGNPFFARELARALDRDPPAPGRPIPLPSELDGLLSERLAALQPRMRHMLLLVASHGRLDRGLMDALAVTRHDLEEATAAHLAHVSGSVLRLTHPLLASAAYHNASHEQRVAAHRQLADVMVDPVARAVHRALAAELPDAALAAELEDAAAVASRRGTPVAAAELGEHALSLTPAVDADDRRRRGISTARAHLASGNSLRARDLLTDLLATTSHGPLRAEALRVMAAHLDEPGSAVDHLEEAAAEASNDPALLGAIHAELAIAGRLIRDSAWAEAHARTAVELAEQLDDETMQVRAKMTLSQLLLERGVGNPVELAMDAAALATEMGDQQLQADATETVAHALAWSAPIEVARAWLSEQLERWAERDEQVVTALLWYLALVETWGGRWDEAANHAERARDSLLLGRSEVPPDILPIALVALHRGQLDRASELSTTALSLLHQARLPAHVAILGIAAAWRGDTTEAVARLTEAEVIADERRFGEPSLRWWRAEHVDALLQLGRVEDAASITGDWESAATRLGRARILAATTRCRGLIAAASGEVDRAAELLAEAAAAHDAAADPFGAARSFLALGIVRLRQRRKRPARDALEIARAAFERMGAESWAREARAQVARIGGRVRLQGLSPSEQRVAALVVEGLTNRQIAAALFLGERTVATHLTHIYSKLGIQSRGQVARHLAATNPTAIAPKPDGNIQTF